MPMLFGQGILWQLQRLDLQLETVTIAADWHRVFSWNLLTVFIIFFFCLYRSCTETGDALSAVCAFMCV